MKPGTRVLIRGRAELPAVVVRVGVCDYGRCSFGADCVTVQEPRWSSTTNYHREQLAEVPEESAT